MSCVNAVRYQVEVAGNRGVPFGGHLPVSTEGKDPDHSLFDWKSTTVASGDEYHAAGVTIVYVKIFLSGGISMYSAGTYVGLILCGTGTNPHTTQPGL